MEITLVPRYGLDAAQKQLLRTFNLIWAPPPQPAQTEYNCYAEYELPKIRADLRQADKEILFLRITWVIVFILALIVVGIAHYNQKRADRLEERLRRVKMRRRWSV
jgi:hypothetical protein